MTFQIGTPSLEIKVMGITVFRGKAPEDPQEVVQMIKEKSIQRGLNRITVVLNGKIVTPDNFDEVYQEVFSSSSQIVIEVYKEESAG